MKDLKDYDWETIRDALGQYADHLEETEPGAFVAINAMRTAAENCPTSDEFD